MHCTRLMWDVRRNDKVLTNERPGFTRPANQRRGLSESVARSGRGAVTITRHGRTFCRPRCWSFLNFIFKFIHLVVSALKWYCLLTADHHFLTLSWRGNSICLRALLYSRVSTCPGPACTACAGLGMVLAAVGGWRSDVPHWASGHMSLASVHWPWQWETHRLASPRIRPLMPSSSDAISECYMSAGNCHQHNNLPSCVNPPQCEYYNHFIEPWT